ncbi:wax ester/triacylglycerol synthase family O-acyltransferase [Actinomadura gamaensis]|uniref:Diacylglycerol O-acyltransferase n=1 Tax=Actinomadura gamaensis TaxID=1763541 RepID=A0ABV9TZA4_9ACTN
MNALDTGMFFAENDTTPLQIAAVLVFEGPPPPYPEVLREIRARLAREPRYRQRVRTVPLNLARPVWDDDPRFRLDYHVRHTALPPPGGDAEFRELVSRVLAGPIDLDRAPWEQWIVEGLAGGRWALVSKVHHCVVDGVAGTDLLMLLLDASPDWRPAEDRSWPPARPASTLSLLGRSVLERLDDTARRAVRPPVRETARVALGALRTVRGLPRYAVRWTRSSTPSLNGPTTWHRRWAWTRVDIDDVRRVRGAFGGTLNDVVLTAVAAGFRDLLLSRDALPDGAVVHTMVPVSTRPPDVSGELDNRVSAVMVNLPCGEPDPLRRLVLVREQMDELKHDHQETGPAALLTALGLAPGVLATMAHTLLRLRQPVLQTIVTNVPGPPIPLYMMGRRAIAIYPYVPIAAGLRVSVGVLSYDGALHVGLTGDFDAMTDLGTLADAVRRGFADLAALATARDPNAGAHPAPKQSPSARSASARSKAARSKPALSKPALSKPARSETARHETARSEMARPETTPSEAARRKAARPETARSEAVRAEAGVSRKAGAKANRKSVATKGAKEAPRPKAKAGPKAKPDPKAKADLGERPPGGRDGPGAGRRGG